jgi:hypothetical protein
MKQFSYRPILTGVLYVIVYVLGSVAVAVYCGHTINKDLIETVLITGMLTAPAWIALSRFTKKIRDKKSDFK